MEATYISHSRSCRAVALSLLGSLTLAASLWAAPPVVKTVPWVANDPFWPHDTWSGKTITLKGTCDRQGANIRYFWDFGDGSLVAQGTVNNRFAVEARHAYTGSVGDEFPATLTIQDTSTGETASKKYYVKIRENILENQINVAIDEGLWWLFKSAGRSGTQYYWNNVQYGNHYANTTASAVQAFQVQGHQDGQPDNPYSEAIGGGLDFLFTRLYVQPMSLQGGENPDSGVPNGIGLSVNSDRPIYESGAVMDAIVGSGTPDARARTGPVNVINRRYQDIVQDMVDMYAWGQSDYSPYYGGWRYSWNGDSDNSAAQWGAIGMTAAEHTPAHKLPGPDGKLGTADDIIIDYWSVVPQWVKTRNLVWLNYSYNGNGWFGYTSPGANNTFSTGPCGMVQLAFDNQPTTDTRWVACERYIANNWASFISTGRDTRYYSYYAFMKAMRTAVPTPVKNLSATGLDWYGNNSVGLARLLVNTQNASGYWAYDGWPYVGEQTAAGWNIIILTPTINPWTPGRPVAEPAANPNPAVAGQEIQLSGVASYHTDPARLIDSWEWDLDNDGIFDVVNPFAAVSFPAVGEYSVALRVTDDGTPEQSDTKVLKILVTTPPVAPTADAGGPYVFCPGTKPWFLDGSRSSNPDEGQHQPGSYPGDTMSYLWDISDDGIYDASGKQLDVTAYFTGKGPGTYKVKLKVTDTTATSFPSSGYGDLSDTATALVTVRGSADPECACVNDLAARAKPFKVQVTWTHTGAHHYNVYRGTVSGGPYLKIAKTSSTYSTYLDQAVENGTTYYYVVREANFLDEEVCQSNQASATPRAR